MADITWFKVLTNIFEDEKIKIIQSMPDGDALLVMWFKLLAQAGKTNDGGYIYLNKQMPYNAGMLSTLFGKTQQTVEVALNAFQQFGMLDIDENGYIFITNWEKHQNIEALDRIREKTRERNKKYRERKRQELMLPEGERDVTRDARMTQRDETDIEEDKELDIDKEKEINNNKKPDLLSLFKKHEIQIKGILQLEEAQSFVGVLDIPLIEHYAKLSAKKSVRYFITTAKNSVSAGITRYDQLNLKTEEEDFMKGW